MDRASASKVPNLGDHQKIIDVDWLEITIRLDEIQVFDDYIFTPIESTWTREKKPQLLLDAASDSIGANEGSSRSRPSGGRKRASTLSATDQPVAKLKRPGTVKTSRASFPMAIRIASASVAKTSPDQLIGKSTFSARVDPSLADRERLVEQEPTSVDTLESTEKNKGAKYERRFLQIVDELDGWCKRGSPRSRTAFLHRMREESNASVKSFCSTFS